MSLSAYDVKIFVWKVTKVSTTTCLNVSRKHPYVTSCLVFLFVLYLCCPLFFWILIYSLPLAVSTWVVLNIRDSRRCEEEREIEREQKERESGRKLWKEVQVQFVVSNSDDHGEREDGEIGKRLKKGLSRVRSVRRRRPKEIAREDEARIRTLEEEAEEEKKAILSTVTVDKTALVLEESPKEIREVEVDNLLTNVDPGADVSIDHDIYHNSDLVKSLKLLKDEEEARDEASKAMDVNLAEAEKKERLESLIAKRRSQKTPSLQARKPSVNTDAATTITGPQMAPIIIPKINTWSSPSKNAGQHSPGSAPSVLVPMRNPFDLPYDPQEEKLDLTGDSFQQEFALGYNREFMFCRHESFCLGPSLPMDFFEDRDDASSIDDFAFRRRRSSIGYGYRFPKPHPEESDTDMGMTTEGESKSNMDSPNSSEEMKEVIQEEGSSIRPTTESNTRHNPLDELSLSSNCNSNSNSNSNSSRRSSMGSSEDEHPPVCKINREAILKSLSMRRNSVSVPDIQENNLSYANSALENASRLKQEYFADKPQKSHGMTFSIASDMHVEVSEVSSPPLTIGENLSYQDDASEMERNASWDGLDSWAGSSRMSETEDNETRPAPPAEAGPTRSSHTGYGEEEKHCITSSSSASESQATQSSNGEEQQPASEDAKSPEETVVESSGSTILDSNDPAHEGSTERLHHATISPKSVLQPTLSVASFDHEGEDEAQQPRAHPVDRSSSTAPQNSASTVLHFTGDRASQELTSEPLNASDEQLKIPKNDEKLKGVADGSTSEMVEIHEKPAQARDESSSSSTSSTSNGADSANEKQNIQGNDEVTGGGSSEKEMGNEETTHNESSKRSSSDDREAM